MAIKDYFRFYPVFALAKKLEKGLHCDSLVKMRKHGSYLALKRIIGFFGSLVAATLLTWFLFLLFLINLIVTKGHPLFVQERIGRDGKSFKMLKFRSMRYDAPKDMTSEEIGDPEKYVTWFGKFLRKTSIDEWPQIYNIFIGQMAWIGPRPLINKGCDVLTIQERQENGSIHLRPGMSGLAQISGRVNVDPKKKGNLDGYYYEHISFGLDIKIFFLTIHKVFHHEGVKKDQEEKPCA